jgi:hypothetical protein
MKQEKSIFTITERRKNAPTKLQKVSKPEINQQSVYECSMPNCKRKQNLFAFSKYDFCL